MTEREIFYRHLGLPSFFPMDLEIVKAEGVWFYDRRGKNYMDLVAGITVSNTGHRHPKVIEAIKNQIDQYLHLNVYGEFIQSPQVRLAKKLTDLLPPVLDSVFFVNSGSEAVEGALKLVKRFTGRTKIFSFYNAYHGSTHGSLSIMGHESLKNAFRPLLPDVFHLEFNNPDQIELIDQHTACVVMETIQAEAGMIPADHDFLHKLIRHCRSKEVLVVLDDVQMGLGRTGKMFSFELYGFVPDILVLAKALGAGMPLGAFIAGKKIMDTLAYDPELGHITTFGGHPVSCAAGCAGLDILQEERLPEEVERKGHYLESLIRDHPSVKGIRRAGLAFGVDLHDPAKKGTFMKAAIEAGVIIDWFLFAPATFRIAPPLTITTDEIRTASERLIKVFNAIR